MKKTLLYKLMIAVFCCGLFFGIYTVTTFAEATTWRLVNIVLSVIAFVKARKYYKTLLKLL